MTFLSCPFSCSSLLHSASCLHKLVIISLFLKCLFWNQPANSEGFTERQRHPEADKDSQHDLSVHNAKNTHWKHHWPHGQYEVYGPSKLAVTCTDLCHTEQYRSPGYSTLAWKSKQCLLQWIHTNTHTEQCKQLLLITQLQDKWDHGLKMTCRIQKTVFIQENTIVLWTRKEVWVWVAMEIFK